MKKDNSWIVALVCFVALISTAAIAGALVGVLMQAVMRYIP